MFYIPRFLWKSSEGGKVKMLIGGLMEPLIGDSDKADMIQTIVKYFKQTRGQHGLYAIR